MDGIFRIIDYHELDLSLRYGNEKSDFVQLDVTQHKLFLE